MTFPPKAVPMNAPRLTTLFLLTVLISPLASLAQSEPPKDSSVSASAAASTSTSNYVVSVQQLKMSGKSRKAFDQGTRLLLKGDPAGSLPYFQRAIAEYSGHYMAYYNMGIAHYRLGHIADAEQAFQKSIDLTGGAYGPPQFAMGMVLCEEHEFRQAETALQRGLDVDPGSATGKYFLGWAQFALNRLVDAERSVRQALLRKANFADAYFLLARIHQRQNNAPAVVEDLNAYLKLDPDSRGNAQARALLEKTQQALQQNPDSVILDAAKP
jgi:tetratricopeptide (TPR) repeat protein